MPKKIYDIKPPKVRKSETSKVVRKEVKDAVIKAKEKRPLHAATPVQHHTQHKKAGHPIVWLVLAFVLAAIIAAGVYLFFKLPKADIVIWPKVDTASFQQTVVADKSATSINLAGATIPAQYFTATKTNSQSFPATGSASNEGEATGTITVYNKYDPSTPLSFVAGTHFVSDSGKLFVTLKKITVPGSKKSGGAIVPGSVQINVQAVESGSDYNIAPSNFSVPGLKGTSSYYSIYATSSQAMSGGYTGKVKKVTDDDIQGAKDILTKKTTDDAAAALKTQIPSGYVLLDGASSSNVTDASTQTKSGSIADNFTYQVSITSSALAFKESDLEQFAKNYISSQTPQGKTLLASSFKISETAGTVDMTGGKETINLNFSSGVYQDVDKNSLALSLLGENAAQINSTISNSLQNGVSKVQINFWPFWVTSAPNNQKAVNVELKFQ